MSDTYTGAEIERMATEIVLHKQRSSRDSSILTRHITDLRLGKQALLAVLAEAVPATDDGWWCPTCRAAVAGSQVTYEEYHESCGTYLGAVNDPEWITRARAAITKAEGESA